MPNETLSGFDPLTLSLHFDVGQAGRDVGQTGQDAAGDPMLVELVVSLPVIQTAAAPAMEPTSPVCVATASLEDEVP
jgi:hypothetical protein